jgi:hypothetical protein
VHSLSPVKNARNSRTSYFDCLIQTSTDQKVRAVCFDPPKRVNLQQAFQQKSPVKITGVKRSFNTSFSTDQEEYKIPKQAKIQPATTEFEFNPKISSCQLTVKQALSADLYKTIDIYAKVMSKQENKQPILKNGKKIFKVDCIIADETDSIKLVLWEELISQVESAKSYLFRGVTSRVFDDVKYLSTNDSTIIEAKDNIANVNLTSNEIKDNIIDAQCLGVHIKKQQTCVICNHTLEFNTHEELVTCPHCDITMLRSTCTTKLVCSLTVKTSTGKLKTLTCFNDAVQSFLVSIKKEISVEVISHEELQKLILHAGQVKMIVDKSSGIIYQFLN